MLLRIVSKLFKVKLEPIYKIVMFLDLDMEAILNESLVSFQDFSDKMSHKVQRQAWTFFLEKTVICYIQCMLNSSSKIKASSSEKVVVKIRDDYEIIQNRF